MKVKDLIRQLTEFDMEKEVRVSVDYEHDDGFGGTCKGYSFPIEGIELFAGGVDILFPSDMVDRMAKTSNIKELEKVKEEIAEAFSSSVADCIYIIGNHISELKSYKCDNNHDCEHCDWVECPEMKGDNNGK